ncbi:RNA 2',3'-cyclic phosphodiesterase [Patescibacteria group bacterium]|nr:RNA 2',3'-cyclic phosphodiesterase [Patescibacteria group bacterium]
MKRRLFIALNLADDIKDDVESVLKGIPLPRQFGLRPVARENWHITVLFLGDQEEEDIPRIEAAMSAAVLKRNAPPPHGKLRDLTYGPVGARPRAIWVNASRDASDGIGYLKRLIEAELAKEEIGWEEKDRERFEGHVTLARFNQTPLRSLPHLQKPLNFEFSTPTLDLVSSELRRGGPRYSTVAKIAF